MIRKSIKQWMGLCVIISVILTLILANRLGRPVQYYETRLYQLVTGKYPQHIQYDSSGVPVVYYEGKLEKQYNIVSVAEETLRWSAEKDSVAEKQFFTSISWLIQTGKLLNDSSIIFCNYYDWSHYEMKAPWRSAMNQGRVMQSFLKAFKKTRDSIYLEYARKSMNTLYTEVKNGGVTYIDNTGYWYEEYADDNVQQSRVLNGMIVVLQGLSDYYNVTKDPGALYLFEEGVRAVKNTLDLYDNNGHSNYDVLGKPASPWYHRFHIELLGFLYDKTREPVFNEYQHKWMKYKEPSYLVSLIRNPTNIGLFTVFTIFVAAVTIVSIVSYFIWFRKK